MTTPTRGPARAVRAVVFGSSSVSLALAAHVAAGEAAPGVLALLLLAIPLGCLSVLLASRRRGLGLIGAAMAGSQIVLHEIFMLLSSSQTCTTPAMPAGAHLGHPGGSHLMLSCGSGMAGMTAAHASASGWSSLMLAAHAGAAVVMTLVLAYGERLVWRFAAWAARAALVLAHQLRIPAPGARPGPVAVTFALPSRRAAGSIRRRGPPQLVAITA